MCDLLMWWFRENRNEDEWHRERSLLEIPPPGYDGSLKGTVWDQDQIVAGYGGEKGDWS